MLVNACCERIVENMEENDFQEPYNDLMGDIIKKHEEKGGMDNLSGKGKPLGKDYLTGDTLQRFQRIAKDAGYKPHWLNLQQEISDDIQVLADYYVVDMTVNIEEQLKGINKKILKYNRICPPPMQKGPIHSDTLKNVLEQKK